MDNRKSITEVEMVAFLSKDGQKFGPLQIDEVQTKVRLREEGRKIEPDALLTMRWRNRSYRFVVEMKGLWTPKVVSAAIEVARDYGRLVGAYPMIVVPYLNDDWLQKLGAQGVSGIDLCGNGVVIVLDELLVLRTGFPNRFRWPATIKNVYRKNSSVIARIFLLVPSFRSVKEVLGEIGKRSGEVTLATVSKVCKSLEDDLVIEGGRRKAPPASSQTEQPPKSSGATRSPSVRWLRLLQPEKLLGLLADNYQPPDVSRTYSGKTTLRSEELVERLVKAEEEGAGKVVLTGASSVEAYAVMAREPVQSFYCTDIDKILANLGGDARETDRFANVRFQQTRDPIVYFDRRPGLVASPIQSYLELKRGDKREQETADQVRRVILGQRAQASREEG